MRILLIDADILIYRAASVSEVAVEWEEGIYTNQANAAEAKTKFSIDVETLIKKTKADRYLLAISDDINWRKSVLPTYKETRNKLRKPILLKPMRKWVQKEYPKNILMEPSLEGDDVIGLRATCGKPHTYIMASIDKDMKCIPGLHYNFDKEIFSEVTPQEAHYNHMVQTLTGDITDNYKGLPGCGKVKAAKILDGKPGEYLWGKVVAAYKKNNLTEQDALVQASVAFILQGDRKPGLWFPYE